MTAVNEPEVDMSKLLDELAAAAATAGPEPTPIAQGTFAMYPMPDGGLMFVTSVAEGPMAGTRHMRMPPSLIRAAGTFLGGGGKVAAIKGLFGGRRREIAP